MLEQKGFVDRWIKWISGCLDHPHFSILLNGTSKAFFESSKGQRQGDPLSPLLFTLVADGLRELMARAKDRGVIEGFTIGNEGFLVNHLQFADDTMCFLKADVSQVWMLKDILKIFKTISGLKINISKTSLAGVEVRGDELSQFAQILGCKIDVWPLKYLGLPLGKCP